MFRARAFLVPCPHSLAPKSVGAVAVAIGAALAIAAVVAVFAIFPATSIGTPGGLGDLALPRQKKVVAERTCGATSAEVAQSILEA